MTSLDRIFNQPMSRKQFLLLIGTGIITFFGIPTILGILSPDNKSKISSGYGSSRYNA